MDEAAAIVGHTAAKNLRAPFVYNKTLLSNLDFWDEPLPAPAQRRPLQQGPALRRAGVQTPLSWGKRLLWPRQQARARAAA